MIGTEQNSNTENRYKIILELKKLQNSLLQCTDFDACERCRLELLAYIEENPLLKNICKLMEEQQNKLLADENCMSILNRIHSFVITLENTHASLSQTKVIRNKVYKFEDFEQVSITIRSGEINTYVDIPSKLFFPSITHFSDRNIDYLQQIRSESQVCGLRDLYNLFDNQIGLLCTYLSVQYGFEYTLMKQSLSNLGLQTNNFNAAYLYCIVCAVNKLLQHKVENYKALEVKPVNNILSGGKQLPHTTLQGRKSQIFKELCKDPTLSASNLGTYFGTKPKTIETQFKELARSLYNDKHIQKPKTVIVEYIKMHNLHTS